MSASGVLSPCSIDSVPMMWAMTLCTDQPGSGVGVCHLVGQTGQQLVQAVPGAEETGQDVGFVDFGDWPRRAAHAA